MPRVISVFLRTLSTDRVRRKAGDKQRLRRRCCSSSWAGRDTVGRLGGRRGSLPAGLRVGMPASKAQALVQGLVIQDAKPRSSRRHRGVGAARVLDFAARCPNCRCRSTGRDRHRLHRRRSSSRRRGRDARDPGREARRRWPACPRATIADTWGAAHALARFDPRLGSVSEPGSQRRTT